MLVDPDGLIEGAGEAVEDVAGAGVGFGEALGDELVDDVIRDEKTAGP